MGATHTIDVCKNCGDPVIQWNNTGAYEHLGSATMDQALSRKYHGGATNATICNNPRLLVEQNSVSTRTAANYRTATKRS